MKRFIICLVAAIALGLVGGAAWLYWPRHDTYFSDADTIRTPAGIATVREILWQPPMLLGPRINTSDDEYESRLSADGRTLVFVRGRTGGGADIYISRQKDGRWSRPRALAQINSSHDDLGPALTPDGDAIYFYSDRPGGLGGYDLWVSRLVDEGWSEPTNLGERVNSTYNDYGPALSADGGVLYFASNRPREAETRPEADAWKATLREDLYQHDYDLYAASITQGGIQPASALGKLNSPANEGAPAASPFGDFLYFASDRAGGQGGFDLYRSRRLREEFETPANLGAAVNTAANELDPTLEMGGYALQFSSDRAAQDTAPTGKKPDYNLYRSVSREVFREVQVRRASIDWAALWRQIGPNLMWALLALILTLLLLALLRDLKNRKLSLLARCLLVSLLLHTLMMLLFNVMEVSTSIAAAIRKGGGIRISLASVAQAGEIGDQIRGGLTNVDAPRPAEAAITRQEEQVSVAIESRMENLEVSRQTAAMDQESIVRLVASDAATAAPQSPSVSQSADLAEANGVSEFAVPVEISRRADAEPELNVESGTSSIAPLERSATDLHAITGATGAASVEVAPAAGNSEIARATESLATTGSAQDSPAPAPQAARGHIDPVPEEPGAVTLDLDLPPAGAVAQGSDVEVESPERPHAQAGEVGRQQVTGVVGTGMESEIQQISPSENGIGLSIDAPLITGDTAASATDGAPTTNLLPAVAAGEEDSVPTADTSALGLGLPDEIEPPAPAHRLIRGKVTDAETGRALANAEIRLDLPGQTSAIARSSAQGQFEMAVPVLPDYVAISASHAGYLPRSQNMAAGAESQETVTVDFALQPETELVIAVEETPTVHHLGNDHFEGSINSQFQRESEGTRLNLSFNIPPGRLAPHLKRAEIELLTKGVQCPHMFRLNGRRLPSRLRESPGDGSFGKFAATFDISLLREGRNSLVVRNVMCRDDTDDFEFINIQIRLTP